MPSLSPESSLKKNRYMMYQCYLCICFDFSIGMSTSFHVRLSSCSSATTNSLHCCLCCAVSLTVILSLTVDFPYFDTYALLRSLVQLVRLLVGLLDLLLHSFHILPHFHLSYAGISVKCTLTFSSRQVSSAYLMSVSSLIFLKRACFFISPLLD